MNHSLSDRCHTRVSSAAVLMLVAVALAACGTTTPSVTTPVAPDTDKQKKVRSDLDQCNTAAGGRAHSMTVSPDGKYSFQIAGRPGADAIVGCMIGKGYSGQRTDLEPEGSRDTIRSGGRGQ
jgi:hypothetical protein